MTPEEAKHRAEERRENKVYITIHDKKTGEIVDRKDGLFYDNAESWARDRVSGSNGKLGYKIYHVH